MLDALQGAPEQLPALPGCLVSRYRGGRLTSLNLPLGPGW
jgi:hypothetical protein